jgi:hypothetical protein
MSTYRLYEPVQAMKVLQAAWRTIKPIIAQGQAMVMTIKPETRTNAQNDKMWAMLTDVSNQVEWHGRYLAPEDWKHIFSAALKAQEAVPGIHGGFVVLGQRTSKMTKAEMSDLIELMHAFAADRDVKWSAND